MLQLYRIIFHISTNLITGLDDEWLRELRLPPDDEKVAPHRQDQVRVVRRPGHGVHGTIVDNLNNEQRYEQPE